MDGKNNWYLGCLLLVFLLGSYGLAEWIIDRYGQRFIVPVISAWIVFFAVPLAVYSVVIALRRRRRRRRSVHVGGYEPTASSYSYASESSDDDDDDEPSRWEELTRYEADQERLEQDTVIDWLFDALSDRERDDD